ncbi:MAG: acyl-CoA thioesterase [Chlorobi bacterium]|nr:acyl-CoA thioesterase [Chlorobiota bacterium]
MDKEFDISTFKHSIKEKVKFHEVDMIRVLNNAVYLNYFEDARTEYLLDLNLKYQLNHLIKEDSFFLMRRNEVEYLHPATFNDELIVYTKMEWVKNTSFGFRHVIKNEKTGQVIAVGSGIMVYIKVSTKKKQPLPDNFVKAVKDFEGDSLKVSE